MSILRRHPTISILTALMLLTLVITTVGMRRVAILQAPMRAPILVVYDDSLTSYQETSATIIQDIRPQHGQRGVNIEGSLRGGAALPMALHGNPFENVWQGGPGMKGPINLSMGTYQARDIDLSLPAPGFRWNIARSYNARQEDSGSSHRNSDGYQGKNWFQDSQPEIVLFEHATDNEKDVVYLVHGANRFIEFKRVELEQGTSNTFVAVNGAAGLIQHALGSAGEPNTFTYTDQHSNRIVFFGFDADANPALGQIWKMTDPDGNVAYVGDATTGSTAISNGYTANGQLEYVYDTADRRFTYAYTTLDSVERLTEVKAETKTGGTWASPTGLAEVGKVVYEYYTNESNGDPGDLKLVERTIPLTDSGISQTRKKYYRYWEGTYNASSNPGYPHAIKLVLDDEGARNYDWQDTLFDEDFMSDSQASLEPYAAAYMEYDSSHRVNEAWFQGSCGCGGGSNGTHLYEYETNGSYSDNTGYDTTWAARTVVKRPDGSYHTQHFDETHQPVTSVITDADPDNTDPVPDKWVTQVTRNSNGVVTKVYTPASNSTYTHSTGTATASTTVGLVWTYVRAGSGMKKSFVGTKKFSEGSSGTLYLDGKWTWHEELVLTPGGADTDVLRPVVKNFREYTTKITTGTSGSNKWAYANTVYSGTLALETITTTEPIVSTGNNGSGTAVTTKVNYNKDGTQGFQKSGSGVITYREHTNGQLTKLIRDADTTKTASGEDFENVTIPTGFASSGSPIHARTEYAFDVQGRQDTMMVPGGRIEKWYHSRLKDHRSVTTHYPKYESTPKFYGPADYLVRNHAGTVESNALVSISGGSSTSALTAHVDETDGDPITAMDLGTLCRMTMSTLNEAGEELQQTRLHYDIPTSGAGTDGTNYDPTLFGYDSSGRRWRVKEATGTIRRTLYNLHGQVTEQWIGTNDSSFSGGESSGTDNMVKVEALEYDSAADDGNGLVTKRTLYVEDSATDKRESQYTYDVKGGLLLQTNPISPHGFHKLDNLGRTIATGLFSATTNIVVGTDDPTTETSNRVGLAQAFFDQRGDLWKTQRHRIDVADGSDGDNLQSLTWFDKDRRAIKVDGSQLSKTTHDGLGRTTHRFVLASDNDTAYADAEDVTGDIVLGESQTTFDASSGDVLMVARIERFHDDAGAGQTTGALDTNADSDSLKYPATNLEGRIQIEGLWYDNLGRIQDRVSFGTYGDADFDRDGMTVPARSDTALRSTSTYNDDGRLEKTEDPRGVLGFTEYDDAGRGTREVRNYDPSVNTGLPSGTDDNVTVKREFMDGLQTKLTADLPSGETDQDTIYTYGTAKGATAGDSKIATGHLLQKTQYPDSSGGTDVVTLAYNAQGQQIWKKDQAGNIFEWDLDDGGQQTEYRWTTAVSGFDTAVRRTRRTYTSQRLPDLVTQYDNATVGSGSVVDEVRYTHDGWGGITKFDYDRDSAVDASGSDDEYTISYAYAKATGGRNTVRRTSATLPSGNQIDYNYTSTDSHDSNVSRVSEVKDGATVLSSYDYLGVGRVVGMTYDEPDSMWQMYGATSGSYPDLDVFGRVTSSRWTKDLATDRDFYDCDITYDRNGNISLVEDNVHTGFDVSYSIDELNRVTQAEEGTWSGSAITSRTRDQQWTPDQVGNWNVGKLDLNGDGDFIDTDEHNDDRTHNAVNELTGRDTDDNGTDDFTLVYDALGNLTDDDETYKYEYDGFGRLRKVKKSSDSSLVAEYKYNGLGHLTAVHEDNDAIQGVGAGDKWFHRMYDERWRWVANFRESDTSPKEEFVAHQAGFDGSGRSSYVDLVILRDKDANTSWTSASDGTLEDRVYYCQNWRADVSAIIEDTGEMVEWVKYSAYGVPHNLARGDTDSSDATDSTDRGNIDNWSSGYDVRYDVDLDGDIDSADSTAASDRTGGRAVLSIVGNTLGLAGYATSITVNNLYHARNRVLDTSLGRWSSRDPLENIDGLNLYQALASSPVVNRDPTGLACEAGYCFYLVDPPLLVESSSPPTFGFDTFASAFGMSCYYEYHLLFATCPIRAGKYMEPACKCDPEFGSWTEGFFSDNTIDALIYTECREFCKDHPAENCFEYCVLLNSYEFATNGPRGAWLAGRICPDKSSFTAPCVDNRG